MLTISVIIPNYNGEKLLKSNLPSILELASNNKQVKEIIIIDDNSKDQSVNYIEKNFPDFIIVKKEKNTGYPDTVNKGVAIAKGDLVLILNTDVKPKKDVISYLLPYFEDNSVFAVGCLDNSVEGDKIIQRGRGVGCFKKGFLTHKRGEVTKNDTLWVSGGSSMFSKKIWDKLGGMDAIYSPFYWEDIDLSYRALKSGYKIYFEKKAQVSHFHSEGSIIKNYPQNLINQISFRNQIIFVWKNISSFKYLLNHVLFLTKISLVSLLSFNLINLKALGSAFSKIGEIFSKRNKARIYWVKKDEEILKNYAG